MRTFLIIAIIAAVSLATGPTNFQASVTISNDPSLWGEVGGTLYYYYDGTNSLRAIDFNIQAGTFNEVIVFKDRSRYLRCPQGVCQAEAYGAAPDRWFLLDTDQLSNPLVTVDGCQQYSRAGDPNGITKVYKKAGESTLCAVVYSNGKKVSFSGYTYIGSIAPSHGKFAAYGGWACPNKVCNTVLDLILVLDESGSIGATDYGKVRAFAKNLVNKFKIGNDAVNVGVVTFSDFARKRCDLTGSYNTIMTALDSKYEQGATCIGCGIYSAVGMFKSISSARAAMRPRKVMVLLTDGANNRPTKNTWNYLADASRQVKELGTTCLAVGVGKDPQQSELNLIATSQNNVLLVYRLDNFDVLASKVNEFADVSCQDYPTEPCGPNCHGFCGCDRACYCPTCPKINDCYSYSCIPNQYYNGCKVTMKNCDDNKACTTDGHDNQTSGCCVHGDTNCNDNNQCTNDGCLEPGGCYHQPVTCAVPTNKCLKAVCTNGAVGCENVPIDCNDNNPCTDDSCDPLAGCQFKAKNCSDSDECTIDSCKVVNGQGVCSRVARVCQSNSACIIDKCDPVIGCVATPRVCKPTDLCYKTSCDPANFNTPCSETRIPGCQYCSQKNCQPSPNDRCHSVNCTEGTNLATTTCNTYDFSQDPSLGCFSNDKCILDICNPTDGTCTHRNFYVECERNTTAKCKTGKCDTRTGKCVAEDVVCTPRDNCYTAACDISSGLCVQTPKCKNENCALVTCVSLPGTEYQCNYERDLAKVCPTGSACQDPTCNNATGICGMVSHLCVDNDNCTIDTCDPVTGCSFPHVPCQLCEKSTCCDPGCDDKKICTDDSCIIDTVENKAVCVHGENTCPSINLTETEKTCYFAYCSEVLGCYRRTAKGAFVDACGTCVGSFGTSSKKSSTVCFGALEWPQFAGALAGGVVAAIVIAAVIGFLAFAAASAFGTWKLIQMSKSGKGMAAHNNPMYKPSDHESVNPAYNH